jgi:threonine aldolase
MRQAGVIAAAALYALEHQMARLADDHARALALATVLSECPRVAVDLASVQSNIVLARAARAEGAAVIVGELRAAGVLCGAYDRRTVRFVTHLDFGDDDLEAARGVFGRVLT